MDALDGDGNVGGDPADWGELEFWSQCVVGALAGAASSGPDEDALMRKAFSIARRAMLERRRLHAELYNT